MVKKAVSQLEQSTLSKAVKNVKQKLLTKVKKPENEIKLPTEISVPKTDQVKLNRGVVYLGHIPHGFFEEQMRDYFKQFGRVTRVRLVRSKKTGRSRGYGYVEFLHNEVAQIAAESMNNYLMCGRLLKATYIPPEKQHGGFFVGRQWSKQNYPRLVNRAAQNIQKNRNVDNKVEASLVERGLSKISNMEKKLEAVGIIYKIKPVEVPAKLAVKKRKAAAQLPPAESKKRKIASVDSTEFVPKKETKVAKKETKVAKKGTEVAKKETKVAKPVVKKIDKKDTGNKVLAKKTKPKAKTKTEGKKIESMVKSIQEESIKSKRVLRQK